MDMGPTPTATRAPDQTVVATGHGKLARGLAAGAARLNGFGRFGRMFPGLPPLDIPDADLHQLADTMLDTEAADGSTGFDNDAIPSGFTYLGQFVDHDLTEDTTSIGAKENDPDAVIDFRTPRLDLDNVYGSGPSDEPYLYDRLDPRKMALGRCGPGGGGDAHLKAGLPNDLPRGNNGVALIGDPRNDENLFVAQTHVAMLKFHNKVVDRIDPQATGDASVVFAQARRTVIEHYQSVVLHDFLPRIVDAAVIDDARVNGRKLFRFEELSGFQLPFMPIEFSAAAYRLGHSMVREKYDVNRAFRDGAGPNDFSFIFNFTALSGGIIGDLDPTAAAAALKLPQLTLPNGGKIPAILVPALPADWVIDWHRFYDLGAPEPPPAGAAPDNGAFKLNVTRSIDPYLSRTLHTLPGGTSLPFRNLMRGVRLGLPSAQSIIAAIGDKLDVHPLTPDEIAASGPDGAMAARLGLHQRTPLWYYILKEAQLRGGSKRLGPLGGRIVAEVFVAMVQVDGNSILNKPGWKPSLPSADPTRFQMTDLLRFVNDLDPINLASNF